MNLKSKLFGFGATALLALSITTGAMAADPVITGQTPAKVTLAAQNGGVCTMTVDGSTIDFGTLTWNGKDWGNQAPDQNIDGTVTTGKNKQTCTINAQSAGVSNTTKDASDKLLAGQIDLLVGSTRLNSTDWQPVESGLKTGKWDIDVTLDDATDIDEPGVYEGTVHFQVVSAGA